MLYSIGLQADLSLNLPAQDLPQASGTLPPWPNYSVWPQHRWSCPPSKPASKAKDLGNRACPAFWKHWKRWAGLGAIPMAGQAKRAAKKRTRPGAVPTPRTSAARRFGGFRGFNKDPAKCFSPPLPFLHRALAGVSNRGAVQAIGLRHTLANQGCCANGKPAGR